MPKTKTRPTTTARNFATEAPNPPRQASNSVADILTAIFEQNTPQSQAQHPVLLLALRRKKETEFDPHILTVIQDNQGEHAPAVDEDPEPPARTAEWVYFLHEYRLRARNLLQDSHPRTVAALILQELGNFSAEELGQVLGISAQGAKMRLWTLRKRFPHLRAHLSNAVTGSPHEDSEE